MADIDWTAELLIAALERYVLKRRFTEKDRELIRKHGENSKNFDARKIIRILIDNSEGRLDIYEPVDCLLNDLEVLVTCPHNSAYFGVSNGLNYENLPMLHTDTKGQHFVAKTDVFLLLYRFLMTSDQFATNKEVMILLLKSHGNRIYRKLNNFYEIVPNEIALEVLKTFGNELKNSTRTCSFNLSKYTTDEIGWNLSKFYDVPNDGKLLQQLKDQLIMLNKKVPIRSNTEYYKKLYADHVVLAETIKNILVQFPFVFQPYNAKVKNFPFYPIIRVFKDTADRRLVMEKDLEVATQNRIRIKKSKQDSVLLTIPENEMKTALENSGLDINDFHIFECPIVRTSRNIAVPIITPFGTHCKLALDAFNDVVEVFTTDFRWFDTVVVKHFYKMDKFFENLSQVFDGDIIGVYFIETRKIDEIVVKAYLDLAKFTTKPAYDFPKNMRFSSLEEIEKEMINYSPNYATETFAQFVYSLGRPEATSYTKSDAINFYHEFRKYQMYKQAQNIGNFGFRQMGVWHIKKNIDTMRVALKTPEKSQLEIRELQEINAHSVKHSKELMYYITLKPVVKSLMGYPITLDIYDNDLCLKKTLDETLKNYPEYETLFGLIYEVENRKSMNSEDRRRVFYLTEDEVKGFWDQMKQEFTENVEKLRESEAMNLEKVGKFYWKEQFPMDEYPHSFHKKMKEMKTNPGELLNVCVEARSFFWKCCEKMRNWKNYGRWNKMRRIVIRIMSEMRVDDQKEWHMFSDDVLEAIEIVLEGENRLDSMKEKLDKWRTQWSTGESYSTIPVKLFETILDLLQIDKSRFLLVPDIRFCKNMVEMPLKMSYNAMKILSPDGREVYHQAQAQYLIFQYGACDVLWLGNCDSSKMGQKARVLMEMSMIEKGYTLAEKIEQVVERVKYSEVVQKTPLTFFHGKSYYDKLTKKHIDQCKKYCRGVPLDETNAPLVYFTRASYLGIWLSSFFEGVDEEIRRNVLKAASVSYGSIRLKCMDDFEIWIESEVMVFEDLFLLDFCIEQAHSINVYKAGNDERPYIEKHYLFDDSDALGSFGTKKRVKKAVENKKNKIYEKCLPLIPKIVEKVSDDDFENLWPIIQGVIMEEFDEEEAMEMCEILPKLEEFDEMKKKVCEMFKRKKNEESEKKVKTPKVVTKYVTEMKIIENCEKCRSIEKESKEFTRIVEEFEKEKEENKKVISRKDEDLIMLKSQINQNKTQYREEIQKFREDVESRDLKIEQLQKEIKEHHEDSRIKRENLCAEFRESSRKANESVKKMRVELENAKLEEKTRNKKIIDLSAENEHLKTMLEIAEENLAGILRSRDESENRQMSSIEKILDPEEILQFDVYTILDKIDANSKSFNILRSEIQKFREKYDVYIRNLENQNCWTTTEIPDFPIPFSAGFMRDYEKCLKEDR